METYLKDPLFTSTDPNVLGSRRLYPRFKTSSSNSLLSSGLLDASRDLDRELLRATADYEASLQDINARLDVSDNMVVVRAETDAVVQHRAKVRDSSALKGMVAIQSSLHNLLRSSYRSAIPTDFVKTQVGKD